MRRACTETSDKHKARDIESTERTRILEGKHGIRRQPDITLRKFWPVWFENYAMQHHRDSTLAREVSTWRTIEHHLGGLMLHEITTFSLEQFKAKRKTSGMKPATIARELLMVSIMLRQAVEWKPLVVAPKVDTPKGVGNRTRILTPDEQQRLLAAYGQGRHGYRSSR